MMDLKFKGPNWVGNIYQKFEAICHEVDDIVKQDTFKYVENQMQSVGKNVKKLCSDLLPPLGHPVKHVAEDVASEEIATVSTKTRKSLQENSVVASENQSPTEPDDPVASQLSLISREHHLGDQLSSLTSMDTLVESDLNLRIGKVEDIMTIENCAADDEEIAKPILPKLTSPGGEEPFSELSVGEFIQSNRENRQADLSEVETSTDELDFGSEQKSRCDYLFEEVESVSGVSTVMVSTTDPAVMDPEHQLSPFSSQYHLLEQLSSPASKDTLKGSESNLCFAKTDGILTNESSDANNEEFSIKAYAPVLSDSNSPGVVEHFTKSPMGVFDQSNDANKHADLSKDEPETSAQEEEFESLENWTLWDDYVDKIERVPDALNSTSEMSFSVVSVENTTEDAGLASFSRSNAEESLRISESSPEKLTQEAVFCLNYIEGVGFVSNFSDAAHETSAHSLECQLDSTAWDDFADETECDSAGSSTTSKMVCSVVSGDTSTQKIGVTSFDFSNAKPLGLSEDSSQELSREAMPCHNSIEAAGCVCDMSEVIHGTSAHGLKFEFQLSSPAWDDCADDNQCVSGPSIATSEVVCSFVSGENAAGEIGVPSFSGSNANEFPRFTENPPQILSEEATFSHSSGGKAGCVSDSSDGSSSSAPALTVSTKNKDTDGLLSSFSSVLSAGTSRSTDTMPLTVHCGKQQVKICESIQHEAAITSSDTGCLDESSSDIAYCHMESIDLHDKVQIQENCVNVEDSVLRAISHRARKQRSYKKQIQDAFTSKKRLVKEYEQLAIWFGDVGLDSSQEANSYKDNSGTHQAGDSEWELL
uniref:uncharacterized protein LOC101314829 isoform X2 n=1 Tax=Fragaria vesca subsp. vesca TaxID=101020 RepID=UPI0005CAEEB3|nr:PREDICTED: uncharacterized protein LOC101314829 isoform X2 [Fragaria vesca subsp. vesca]